jgi:hypothetical protein
MLNSEENKTVKYFYRVKIPKLDGNGIYGKEWAWKPIDIGYIEAVSKKEARSILEEEFNANLSMRSKKEDIGTKNMYLLSLYDPNDYWDNFWNGINECVSCFKEFTLLDRNKLYDFEYIRSGYCCPECEEIGERERREKAAEEYINKKMEENIGVNNPCIYKITNKKTKKIYIGQTRQAVTYRWYQHFVTTSGGTKFYEEIKNGSITDWTFEVIETIEKKDIINIDRDKFLSMREQYWINFYNSIINGYNTATANKELKDLHIQKEK